MESTAHRLLSIWRFFFLHLFAVPPWLHDLEPELLESMVAIRQAAAWADPRLMIDHPRPRLEVSESVWKERERERESVCVCVRVLCLRECGCLCMCACACACVHACVWVCVHMCVCMCVYVDWGVWGWGYGCVKLGIGVGVWWCRCVFGCADVSTIWSCYQNLPLEDFNGELHYVCSIKG